MLVLLPFSLPRGRKKLCPRGSAWVCFTSTHQKPQNSYNPQLHGASQGSGMSLRRRRTFLLLHPSRDRPGKQPRKRGTITRILCRHRAGSHPQHDRDTSQLTLAKTHPSPTPRMNLLVSGAWPGGAELSPPRTTSQHPSCKQVLVGRCGIWGFLRKAGSDACLGLDPWIC